MKDLGVSTQKLASGSSELEAGKTLSQIGLTTLR